MLSPRCYKKLKTTSESKEEEITGLRVHSMLVLVIHGTQENQRESQMDFEHSFSRGNAQESGFILLSVIKCSHSSEEVR